MKVILLQDVAKIGKRSALVEVPDGYALNKLIPKKMAEPATPSNMKKISRLQAEAEASESADEAKFNDALGALSEKTLTIETEVNEKGHAFKAVNESDIAMAAKAAGVEVEESMIIIGEPIKEVGEHNVSLVRGDTKGEFKIEVKKK